MPLVSVVIPTHNRPQMLAEALASMRAQTFTDYEIIVVSNGESSENAGQSRACAASYGARYFELSEGSVSVARNYGVARAQGEWVAFLDDDDVWLPAKLERQLAEARLARADMVLCDAVHSYPDGREHIGHSRPPNGWSYVKAFGSIWLTTTSGVVVRKAAIAAAGGSDPRLPLGEDLDLWRRIAWRHTLHPVDVVLVRMRHGHASLTWEQERRCKAYDLLHLLKMWRDTPADLRTELPSLRRVALPRLAAFIPKLLRQPFHPDRLRRRWQALRAIASPKAN